MVEYLIAAAIALATSGLVIVVGPRLGFVDVPDGSALKAHDRPAVPLGGVGVFLGVHSAMAVGGSFDSGLFVATGAVFILGLVDDRIQLPPKVRLFVEFAAALALIGWADIPLEITNPVHVVVGVVLVVGAINAVNLFDGLDGLVGTGGAVAGVGLALLAAGRSVDGTFGLILASALAGFLVLNWHRAKVFLGDNGAYSIGVFLTYGMLTISPTGAAADVLAALAVLGVFALDLVATVLRRKLAGVPMFIGDRSHLYDQLNDRGVAVPLIAAGAGTVQLAFVGIGLGLDSIDNPWLVTGIWVGIAVAALGLVRATGFLATTQVVDT